MTTSPARFWVSSLSGAAVVGLAAGGVLLIQPDGGVSSAPTLRAGSEPTSPSAVDAPMGAAQAPRSAYRDGQYSATGHYVTPGGDESIGVTLVVAHGVVTDTVVRTEATSSTARQFQIQFATGVAAAVVGRDLAGLAITRVAGASLTSVGFDDALTRIRADADR